MKSSNINVLTSAAVFKNGLGCKTVLTADMSRDRYSFNSFVRGHHVYKDEWTPTVGESLNCVREPLNEKDMRDDKVVGHVPLSYSRCVSQFLEISSSTVTCTVTGKRVNGGGGYGLEVPCQYSFKGNSLAVKWLSERIAKERKIVEDALARNQERQTGSKRKQQGNNSGESCSSAKKARK